MFSDEKLIAKYGSWVKVQVFPTFKKAWERFIKSQTEKAVKP